MTFKKGQSGNPKGRPRVDKSITTMLKDKIDEVPDIMLKGQKNDKTWRELIALAVLTKSAAGDIRTIQELLNRIEGRTVEKIEQTVDAVVHGGIKFVEVKK